MKYLLQLFLLLPLFFTACTKEEDTEPKLSLQETILTSHKWNEVSYTLTDSMEVVIVNNIATQDCLKDDADTFNKNGTWSHDPGVPCSSTAVTYGGTWKIAGDKFTSTRAPSTQEYETFIEELTDTKFVYSHEYNGFKHVHTLRAL